MRDEIRESGLQRAPAPAPWCWRVAAPLALPLVLWWIGSYFLLGDIGLWVDDYSAHLRDPVTGTYEVRRLFEPHAGPFWRPIHMVLTFDLITLGWNRHWLMHGICAVMHLLNVMLLFRVLRRLGMRRTVASVCGLVFLTFPAAYEAIFWPSTISTGISLAIFQGVILLFTSVATRERWGPREWALMSLVGPIMFAIGCWYEQVLTMISCLPFLYIAAAPRLERMRQHVGRMVFPIAMGMAGGMLYAILLMNTATGARRGAKDSFAGVAQLWDKTVLIAEQVWRRMTLDEFLPGAVETGWATLGREWEVGIAAIALLMLSSAAWLAWRWRLIHEEQRAQEVGGAGENETDGRRRLDSGSTRDWWRLALVALAGLALFVSAWLPVVVIFHQRTESRLCYVPLYGMMLMLGPLLEFVVRCVRPWPRMQRGVVMGMSVAVLPVCVVGAISLVGVQAAFQKRYQMDQEQLATLRRLVPEPPPQTMFMALRIADWPTQTGSRHFDQMLIGVWDAVWCANAGLQHSYRRKNITAFAYSRWAPLPIGEVSGDDFVYLGPGIPAEGRRVAWTGATPFTVEPGGQLKLIEEVVFKRKGVEVARVEMPMAKQARQRSPGLSHLFVRGFVVELRR